MFRNLMSRFFGPRPAFDMVARIHPGNLHELNVHLCGLVWKANDRTWKGCKPGRLMLVTFTSGTSPDGEVGLVRARFEWARFGWPNVPRGSFERMDGPAWRKEEPAAEWGLPSCPRTGRSRLVQRVPPALRFDRPDDDE